MSKNIFNISLIFILVNFISGCTTTRPVMMTKDEVASIPKDEKITRATLVDGRIVQYRSDGAHYEEKYGDNSNVIVGFTTNDSLAVTNLHDVRELTAERHVPDNTGTTILCGGGVLAVFVVLYVVAATHPVVNY